MLGRGQWLRKGALLLALCAGAVSASSPPPAPVAASWTADPEDQFLLDVNIRQLRLGDGVRAYNTPEGTCVVLGDFLTTLDVPMRIDLTAKKASGWAFKEENRITIDYAAMTASFGANREPIAPGTIRETPDGWCVQTSALARWFGIGVKPVTAGSVLVLQSEAKLPVEMAIERQKRAAQIHPATFNLKSLPQVRVPYRMWRTPALDFVVSAGMTYRASDGVQVDRQSSVFAAGELAHLSYDAQIQTNNKGIPNLLRVRAYRSDPDGGLLGPLKATHIGVGDVEGFDSGLTGSVSSGRGAVITNRPLAIRAAFDRTHFEGDLPVGWEAELYRNGELLGFAKANGSQRYVFDDVQLLYGENHVQIVLYGPQGQVRTRDETIDIGKDNVPAGKTWYWAGFSQPGKDLITLEKPPDRLDLPRAQATISLEHGIDARTSVGALARMMLIADQRLTFVEGSVRRSIGAAMLEVGAARESNGGMAAHAQVLGKVGPVYLSAEALLANDFHLQDGSSRLVPGGSGESLRDVRASADVPLKIGKAMFPVHADVHYVDHRDGTSQLDAAARLAANLDRFNLATDLTYSRHYADSGAAPPADINLGLIGTAHFRNIRLRAQANFDTAPQPRFRTAELSAYWTASDTTDWEGGLTYDSTIRQARARVSYIRRLDTMALALTGEAATDGSLAFGVNLNFSLDPGHGLSLSRLPLAQAGAVHATVYRDLNDNGVRDPSEPLEKGALVTTSMSQTKRPTDSGGSVVVGGLSPYVPIAVGLDETSLGDPMLVPEKALQVVTPRPGVPADVQIGLVEGGDIEGAVLKAGELGFEGLDLELVDAGGKVVATTRSDFDGFFLFERIAYGSYTIRIAQASASAAKVSSDLGVQLQLSGDKSIVRLGGIRVRVLPVIASAAAIQSGTP